jgi:uncharacterized RDD family membrane protein YckC
MTAGVVTGEAVALDVRLAHWPSRLVAWVIDAAVVIACLIGVNLILARALADRDVDLQLAVALVSYLVVLLGYPITFETLWRGRTLGKAALGLRVVRDDGAPERLRHAVVRAVLMVFEFWGPALVASIISKRAKRLGDLLAGTIVVQTRVPGAATTMAVAMPPPLATWASTLDLSRLSDDLALNIRQFLSRQYELHPAARDAMGSQLVAATQAAVAPPPPAGTPGWAYLSAILAERRRRDEWRLRTPPKTAQVPQPAYLPQSARQHVHPPATNRPDQPGTPGPFAPPV